MNQDPHIEKCELARQKYILMLKRCGRVSYLDVKTLLPAYSVGSTLDFEDAVMRKVT